MEPGETRVISLHKFAITKLALSLSLCYLARRESSLFSVINSPNSLDRNVESSDSARSFLTSLILAPLSPGELLSARICQRAFARQFVPFALHREAGARSLVARGNFSRQVYARTFLSRVVKSLRNQKEC